MVNDSKRKITLVGTRIRQWRNTIPLKGFELAEILKIAHGSLSDIENNKTLPSADTIAKFHINTNINILWLLTGKGSMIKATLAKAQKNKVQKKDTSDVDIDLEILISKFIRIYKAGDLEKKAWLKGFLDGAD